MKRLAAISLLPTGIVLLAGCVSNVRLGSSVEPGSYADNGTMPVSLAVANPNARVLFMDQLVATVLADMSDRGTILPDGRLRAEATLQNRTGARIQVQVQCVFLDAQGRSYGDETEWRTLTFGENATETVPFDSLNSMAQLYFIRIRQIR